MSEAIIILISIMIIVAFILFILINKFINFIEYIKLNFTLSEVLKYSLLYIILTLSILSLTLPFVL